MGDQDRVGGRADPGNLCRRRAAQAARRRRRVRRRHRLLSLPRQGLTPMTLIELASLFEERKLWIVTASGLDKDALHIYFGMALFLAELGSASCRERGGKYG